MFFPYLPSNASSPSVPAAMPITIGALVSIFFTLDTENVVTLSMKMFSSAMWCHEIDSSANSRASTFSLQGSSLCLGSAIDCRVHFLTDSLQGVCHLLSDLLLRNDIKSAAVAILACCQIMRLLLRRRISRASKLHLRWHLNALRYHDKCNSVLCDLEPTRMCWKSA